MSHASNVEDRGRNFARHSKALLQELEFLGTNVKSCPEFHGWVNRENIQSDRTTGLAELASAIENFANSLRSLLSGNKFWLSSVVTDRSGVRDLKELKVDVENLEPRLARIMDSEDQTNTLTLLRELTSETKGKAQDFEKLREDMLVRVLDKAAHANDKNDGIDQVIAPPLAPQLKEKEMATESDPYSKRRYLWLFLGLLIFRNAILTHIPHMLLYAILLHGLPAFQIARATVLSQSTASEESWQDMAQYCPVISLIDQSSPQSTRRPKPSDASTAEEQPVTLSIAPENDATRSIETSNIPRTEEHVMAEDGPGLRFVVPNGTAPGILST